jgi:hypothetical protein
MIEKILIRGERCSGTNYLYSLIEKNFNIELCSQLGWKHSYINIFNKNLHNHEKYLVIFIFRNPIDWIGSLYQKLWHFEKSIKKQKYENIGEFIISEPKQLIKGLNELKDFNEENELYWERNPFTLKRAENICELRNWKNENYLSSTNILSNVEFVKYEKLFENPRLFMDYINDKYIKQKYEFENVTTYKGLEKKGTYIPKQYEKLTEKDLIFIENNLDWELENKIGYKKTILENYVYE